MGVCVGIDLGTTFSCVARIGDTSGKPYVIKNNFGEPITPSVLCFTENDVLYGSEAKSYFSAGDPNAVAFFKRTMGNDNFCLSFFGKTYNSTDLSSIFLKKLVEDIESEINDKIESAVITVPAYFTDKERQETIKAAKKADINVSSIINEPTAAAFAYGVNNQKNGIFLVYDLGGGTFDVTLARITDNDIEVLGTDGNHELGGKDWDDCLVGYIVDKFQEIHGVDVSDDDAFISSLLITAENIKKQLSSRNNIEVPINYRDIRDKISISREKFEEISSYYLNITKDISNRVVEESRISWQDIDGIILVGGSTRMPMVSDFLFKKSGKKPFTGINVDEAVALGAAIKANLDAQNTGISVQQNNNFMIGGKNLSDVIAHALGMIAESADGEKYVNSIIIPKNSKIPCTQKRPYKIRTRKSDNFLDIYVLQGSSERPLDNEILNKYVISDIQFVKGNDSVIEVTYGYDSNGIVNVSAIQQENNRKLTVHADSVPSDMSWTDLSPKDNKTNRGNGDPIVVMIALDLSGSMWGKPLERAKNAIRNFVKDLDFDLFRVGFIGFADIAKVVLKPCNNIRKINYAIDSKFVRRKFGSGTSSQPFLESKRIFSKYSFENSYLIVLTDGVWFYQNEAIVYANELISEGLNIMAIGFGSADYEFLKEIASCDEFATMTDLSALDSSFSTIGQVINDKTINNVRLF